MRSRQQGATFLGMVVIISIVGLGIYAAVRLTPLYIEYLAVIRAMEQTGQEHGGGTADDIRVFLGRRWVIEDIKSIQPEQIDIKKLNNGWSMRAWYRAEAPFVGNISLVVDFDKTVTIGSGGAGT